MARPRGFDEEDVVAAAAELFLHRGYEATSVDDLVGATGLHRGSLYKAFGSKRGVFLAALRPVADAGPTSDDDHDLLLVAALELAPQDDQVRALVQRACERLGELTDSDVASVLGRRLLDRAGAAVATNPTR